MEIKRIGRGIVMNLERIIKYRLILISIFLILYSGCISTPSEKGGDTALENLTEALKEGYYGSTGIFYNYAPEKLEAALKSGKPTLVDFSVDWCGACVEMIPTMDYLMTEYGGRANIMTVNADVETTGLQRRYNVRNIPTYLFFDKDGKVAGALIGYQEREAMTNALDELIRCNLMKCK